MLPPHPEEQAKPALRGGTMNPTAGVLARTAARQGRDSSKPDIVNLFIRYAISDEFIRHRVVTIAGNALNRMVDRG